MNDYQAVGIAEGFIECSDEKTLIKAWQHLINTGMVWTLQGWFGKHAQYLIKIGICKKRGVRNE
jgi:glutaminase